MNWERGLNGNGRTHFSKYINNAYVIRLRCIFYKLFYSRKYVCLWKILLDELFVRANPNSSSSMFSAQFLFFAILHTQRRVLRLTGTKIPAFSPCCFCTQNLHVYSSYVRNIETHLKGPPTRFRLDAVFSCHSVGFFRVGRATSR